MSNEMPSGQNPKEIPIQEKPVCTPEKEWQETEGFAKKEGFESARKLIIGEAEEKILNEIANLAVSRKLNPEHRTDAFMSFGDALMNIRPAYEQGGWPGVRNCLTSLLKSKGFGENEAREFVDAICIEAKKKEKDSMISGLAKKLFGKK